MAVACQYTVAAHTSITHDCAPSFGTHTLRFIASTLSPLDLASYLLVPIQQKNVAHSCQSKPFWGIRSKVNAIPL